MSELKFEMQLPATRVDIFNQAAERVPGIKLETLATAGQIYEPTAESRKHGAEVATVPEDHVVIRASGEGKALSNMLSEVKKIEDPESGGRFSPR